MHITRKIIGYGVLLSGIILAPFLPFFFLLFFPIAAMVLEAPAVALFFSILIDSFLLPTGVPFWVSPVFCTILFLPLYAYLRYTVTL